LKEGKWKEEKGLVWMVAAVVLLEVLPVKDIDRRNSA